MPSQPNDRELQRAGTFDCPNCGYHAWVWGLPPANFESGVKYRTCPDCQDRSWGSQLEPEQYYSKVAVELADGSWEYIKCQRCDGKGQIQDVLDASNA